MSGEGRSPLGDIDGAVAIVGLGRAYVGRIGVLVLVRAHHQGFVPALTAVNAVDR